jgi:hypothetical protein
VYNSLEEGRKAIDQEDLGMDRTTGTGLPEMARTNERRHQPILVGVAQTKGRTRQTAHDALTFAGVVRLLLAAESK